MIQELDNEFLDRYNIDEKSIKLLNDKYQKGLIFLEIDNLINFLIEKGYSSDQELADFFEVNKGNITKWRNHAQVANAAIFRSGFTRAQIEFSDYCPATPYSRNIAGIMNMLNTSYNKWFKADSIKASAINQEWVEALICVHKKHTIHSESLFIRENRRLSGASFFSQIRSFRIAANLSDEQIADIVCVWLKPFACVQLVAGYRIQLARVDCSEFLEAV